MISMFHMRFQCQPLRGSDHLFLKDVTGPYLSLMILVHKIQFQTSQKAWSLIKVKFASLYLEKTSQGFHSYILGQTYN